MTRRRGLAMATALALLAAMMPVSVTSPAFAATTLAKTDEAHDESQ